MSTHETAVEMYKHQHDRWNQWALFFLGIIAGAFIIREQTKPLLPLWVPAFLAVLLSGFWVLAALSIRATTQAWLKTVKEVEGIPPPNQVEFQIFHRFEEHYEKHDRLRDLRECLTLWRSAPYRSLTRLLTILGVLFTLLFLILFLICVWKGA